VCQQIIKEDAAMNKRENRMGSDPLAWINKDLPDDKISADKQPESAERETLKSSRENLPADWTRATFIVRGDKLKRLKDYANAERRSLKDVVDDMIEQFLGAEQ
jgi:hypothetical protein